MVDFCKYIWGEGTVNREVWTTIHFTIVIDFDVPKHSRRKVFVARFRKRNTFRLACPIENLIVPGDADRTRSLLQFPSHCVSSGYRF
jgi:hypothetical protein